MHPEPSSRTAAHRVGPADRARRHAALGDEHRLAVVDALRHTDRTPGELQAVVGLPSNLLAFHLDVLEEAGLVQRRRSQGDGRRRYVTLAWDVLAALGEDVLAGPRPASRVTGPAPGDVVFVCTRNAARSQLAAALWQHRTGTPATSAGSAPSARPDPGAEAVARRHGLDPDGWRCRGYDAVPAAPDLVVSVCDRAREAGVPWAAPQLHWSVPDPHGGDEGAYERAFVDIADRVERLVAAT